MKIISIKDLKKKFGKNIIFDNLSIDIMSGQCYLFIGENGSGKSTLFKCLIGLSKIDSGEINMGNIKIGYVPEKLIMPNEMTVKEFLYCFGELKGVEIIELDNIIDNELKKWGIFEKKNRKIGSLSKGMIQKILIIQAVLDNPDLIVFDEVLNGLDRCSQKVLFSNVKQYKETGKTIIIASHYPKEYLEVVDEIYELNGKKVSKVETIN